MKIHPTPPTPAGTEPRGLYNVVLFLLHAKECGVGGEQRMALEEAMKITYLRVGKVRWSAVEGGSWPGRRAGGSATSGAAHRCRC